MRSKVKLLLFLLVLVPLGLLAWLGVWVVTGERERIQQSIRKIQTEQLRQLERVALQVVERRQQELIGKASQQDLHTEALRERVKIDPTLRQVFLLDGTGQILHPPPVGDLTRDEIDFLSRAEQAFLDASRFVRPAPGAPGERPGKDHGWYTWYHGAGINLLFWQRLADGRVIGFELNRYRLVADIVAELPAEEPGTRPNPDQRFSLLDSRGEVLHQWGSYRPPEGLAASVRIPLGPPLNAWSLALFSSDRVGGDVGAGGWLLLAAGLLAVALALAGLAVFLYRESGREVREAHQRVSFVNHVSHELKTPLTNIRMYAELLADELEEADGKTGRYIDVVVGESQRLSRLIENVLTFGRHQRKALRLRRTEAVPDRVIGNVINTFRPLLSAKEVEVLFEPGAGVSAWLDGDVLEQILSNLLGNVEKYASAGGWVRVVSGLRNDRLTVMVADHGPGVPDADRERIFEPFIRLGSELTEGASGTGIGLTIARELARLHGGDLVLVPSSQGAVFKVELVTGPGPKE